MLMSMIVLTWAGKQLSPAEALVVERAALANPEIPKDSIVEFSSSVCEGILTCKGSMSVGTFYGTGFQAYLSEDDGKPRTHDFILLAGASTEPDSYSDLEYATHLLTDDDVEVRKVRRGDVPKPKVRNHGRRH